MQATIEYIATSRYEDSFDIESVGDVALEAYNDAGLKWLLDIQTECGFSTIRQIGPIDVNLQVPDETFFTYSRFRMSYDERKLVKTLKDFANSPRRIITQILEVEHDDFDMAWEDAKGML